MKIPDVNVLIYAHRVESVDHARYVTWLKDLVSAPEPFGLSELVASAFVRIVTHPAAFKPPTPLATALAFVEALRTRSNCRSLRPGANNWKLFDELCRGAQAQGKLVADAYHAALAIEYGCVLITTDGDFARFPGLRWKHPLHGD